MKSARVAVQEQNVRLLEQLVVSETTYQQLLKEAAVKRRCEAEYLRCVACLLKPAVGAPSTHRGKPCPSYLAGDLVVRRLSQIKSARAVDDGERCSLRRRGFRVDASEVHVGSR